LEKWEKDDKANLIILKVVITLLPFEIVEMTLLDVLLLLCCS